MEIKIWNKEDIIKILNDDEIALKKAIIALYARQTIDEKLERKAVEENNKGYSKLDTKFFSILAEKIYLKKEFSEAELAIAKNKIKKYASQLADISNMKVAHVVINKVKKEVYDKEKIDNRIFILNVAGIKKVIVENTYSYNLLIFMKKREAYWDKSEERWEIGKMHYKTLVDLATYEYADIYIIEDLEGWAHKDGKIINSEF